MAAEDLISQEELDEWLGNPSATDVGAKLKGASYGDPDEYVQDKKVADDAGLPVDVVTGNRPEIERQNQVNKHRPEDIARDNPNAAKWLQDPENAKVSYDDLDTLLEIDREISRPWYDISGHELDNFIDRMMISSGKMVDEFAVMMLSDNQVGKSMDKFDESMAARAREEGDEDRAKQFESQAADRTKETEAQIMKRLASVETAEMELGRLAPKDLSVLGEGINTGATMAWDMLPHLAISAASRGRINTLLPFLTGKTVLESYGSGRLHGLTHESAMTYGAMDGAIEYITEKLPTKMVEKMIGDVGTGNIKTALKKWLLSEAGGEQFATAGQTWTAYKYGLDEELNNATTTAEIIDIQARRQAVTFLGTLIGGGGISSTLYGLDQLASREQRALQKSIGLAGKRLNSEAAQTRLDNLIYLAQESKTNERAAEVFEDYMSKIAPDEIVYLDASVIEEMDDAPEYLVAQLDGSTGTIEIPMSKFMADFANNESRLAQVRNHIRSREDLQTQTELEEDTDSDYIKTLLDKAADSKETKDEADRIFEEVKDQIVATGRQAEGTARQTAVLIPALVTTQYEELKKRGVKNPDGSDITVAQLYKDMNFRVAEPGEKVGSRTTEERPEFMTQEDDLEYERASARGLDMSKEARDTRAAEGGFDMETTLWRGSNYDTTRPGLIHTSPDKTTAESFGPTEQVRIKADNTFDIDNPEHLAMLRDKFSSEEALEQFALSIDKLHQESGAMSAESTREHTWLGDHFTVAEYFDVGVTEGLYPTLEAPAVIEIIKSMGFDAMTMREYEWGPKNVAVFDPSQIRSVDAAYDPDFSLSPRVLSQQNFGDITLTESVLDEAGNSLTLVESAQELWDSSQRSLKMLDVLEECMSG